MTAALWTVCAAMLFAAAVVILYRRRTAHIIARLDGMISQAIDGDFAETSFDESRLSALESRLACYLAASATSSRNLQVQRDQISSLVADISHQTRTPVANLRLYAQLLEEQELTEQGRQCAAAISSQTEKLQSLIEALVKSSRLETGLLILHPQSGEIAPMVERAVKQYAPKASEKGVSLTLGDVEGQAVFDSKWTEEALCNLLDNAIKYTPGGGTVTVQVRNYELFSALRVSDTGPGIPESEQTKIFARFYRAPGAWQAEGVGVGLYLTRRIAENQGGYVKVESAPGRGSVFSLYLPRG